MSPFNPIHYAIISEFLVCFSPLYYKRCNESLRHWLIIWSGPWQEETFGILRQGKITIQQSPLSSLIMIFPLRHLIMRTRTIIIKLRQSITWFLLYTLILSRLFSTWKKDSVSVDIARFDIARNFLLHSDPFHVLLRTELFPYRNITERSNTTFGEFTDELSMCGTSFADDKQWTMYRHQYALSIALAVC